MKKYLNNPWFLALLLILINIILISFAMTSYLIFNFNNSYGFFGLVSATILSVIYSKNFKKIMPKKLRVKTALIYTIIMFILMSLFNILMLIIFSQIVESFLIFIITFFSLFFINLLIILEGLIVYWLLGFIGKTYLKNKK